ncbi:MAG: GNAT family N-acetyltransferase [Actinomycetota bacterium]
MTADIRTPAEEDREQIVDLLRTSLNFTRAWAEDRGPLMPVADYRCAYEDHRIVAAAAGYRFRQWFGGHDLPMSGIYAVATLPEHRETGLASAAVLQILREARDHGMSVSTLFPAVLRPYRKLGYELGGTFSEHRLDLDAIPSDLGDHLPAVELLDPDRDLDGLKTCYREWSRHGNGPLEPTDDTWWTRRILRPFGEAVSRSVVVRDRDGSIEGFAAFRYTTAEGGHLDIDFGLECLAFATTTDRATRAFLTYFRSFRGVGLWVQWCGPPEDPIAMVVPEQKISTPFRFRWMFRLLDVRGALAERGYPAVDVEVVVAVADPQFPENAGPWRVSVRGGVASVDPAPGTDVRPLPIGVLSSLFSGFLRVPDAVRMGHLDRNDPAVPGLQQLFAGADPWCPFFF